MPETEFMETEAGVIPTEWECVAFTDAILSRRVTVGKVKKRDYLPFGDYPIVDQSKDFIGGYWNDPGAAYDGELPIIIFGDHTRIFKFIDFAFVCGADGTKIVQPNIERFDPYFLFCALKGIDLPSRGYNRHFRLLKEQFLPRPSLPEQRRIATVLSTIQDEIAAQVDLISALREFQRSAMVRLFTYGTAEVSAAAEEVEIPLEWELVPLHAVLELHRESYLPAPGTVVPYVGLEHITPGIPKLYQYGASEEVTSEKTYFYPEQILYGKLRPYLDKCVLVDFEGICSTDIMVFDTVRELSIPEFMVYLLHTDPFVTLATETMTGTNHPRTQWSSLKDFTFPLPPLFEQRRIADILNTIQDKIAAEEDRKTALQDFFSSTLQQLMSGQIRLLSDEGLPL